MLRTNVRSRTRGPRRAQRPCRRPPSPPWGRPRKCAVGAAPVVIACRAGDRAIPVWVRTAKPRPKLCPSEVADWSYGPLRRCRADRTSSARTSCGEEALAVERCLRWRASGRSADSRPRSNGAAAAAFELERAAAACRMLCGLPIRGSLAKASGIARPSWPRAREAGVGHAERLPDALFQECAERLAGDLLDDQAQHVDREAVVPDRARLIEQRRAERCRGICAGQLSWPI